MSLSLRNDETAGESTTVAEGVRERLDRMRGRKITSVADRLLAIGKDCEPRLTEPSRSIEHGDLLYDERGLPR